MAMAAVSIYPVGEGASLSKYVAATQKVLERQDRVRHQLGPMFTTLEGDIDDIFAVIRQMQEAVFAMGAKRVSTTIKIDDRRDKPLTMEGKVEAVRAHLQGGCRGTGQVVV